MFPPKEFIREDGGMDVLGFAEHIVQKTADICAEMPLELEKYEAEAALVMITCLKELEITLRIIGHQGMAKSVHTTYVEFELLVMQRIPKEMVN